MLYPEPLGIPFELAPIALPSFPYFQLCAAPSSLPLGMDDIRVAVPVTGHVTWLLCVQYFI